MANMFKKVLLVLVLLVTFVSSNVLATGELATTYVVNEEQEVQAEIQNMPRSIYVANELRSFSKEAYHGAPPAKVTHTIMRNGVKYTGSLTRVSYADADTRWLAYYSDYVYLVQ